MRDHIFNFLSMVDTKLVGILNFSRNYESHQSRILSIRSFQSRSLLINIPEEWHWFDSLQFVTSSDELQVIGWNFAIEKYSHRCLWSLFCISCRSGMMMQWLLRQHVSVVSMYIQHAKCSTKPDPHVRDIWRKSITLHSWYGLLLIDRESLLITSHAWLNWYICLINTKSRVKRPAWLQQPNVYLEPKWLRYWSSPHVMPGAAHADIKCTNVSLVSHTACGSPTPHQPNYQFRYSLAG